MRSTPKPAAEDSSPDSSPRPGGSSLEETAGRVLQYARTRPTVFTGLELDTPNRLIVWRKPEAAFDARVRSIAGSTPVDLRSAPRSKKDLRILQRKVIHFSAVRDIAVVSIAVPAHGRALDVRISSDLDSGRSALEAKFGTAVTVQTGTAGDIL